MDSRYIWQYLLESAVCTDTSAGPEHPSVKGIKLNREGSMMGTRYGVCFKFSDYTPLQVGVSTCASRISPNPIDVPSVYSTFQQWGVWKHRESTTCSTVCQQRTVRPAQSWRQIPIIEIIS
jgi:hypothetical protein